MLTKPDVGWNNIRIGKFESRARYLTDVPFDCLNAFSSALTYNLPMSVDFDAEGWEFTIVSNNYGTFIIIDDENGEIKLVKENVALKDLAKEFAHDIESNINEWSR